MNTEFVVEGNDYSVATLCDGMFPLQHGYNNENHVRNFVNYLCGNGKQHERSLIDGNVGFDGHNFIFGNDLAGAYCLKLQDAAAAAYKMSDQNVFDMRFDCLKFPDLDSKLFSRACVAALNDLYSLMDTSFDAKYIFVVLHVSQSNVKLHFHTLVLL